MRESIQYALDNHDEALEYALQFAGDMEPGLAEKFVGMYGSITTPWTPATSFPRAAQKLLDLGFEAGLVPRRVEVEFVPVSNLATDEHGMNTDKPKQRILGFSWSLLIRVHPWPYFFGVGQVQ